MQLALVIYNNNNHINFSLCRCHHKGSGSGRSSIHSVRPGVRFRSEEGHTGDSDPHDYVQRHQRETGTLAQTLQGRPVCDHRWVHSPDTKMLQFTLRMGQNHGASPWKKHLLFFCTLWEKLFEPAVFSLHLRLSDSSGGESGGQRHGQGR